MLFFLCSRNSGSFEQMHGFLYKSSWILKKSLFFCHGGHNSTCKLSPWLRLHKHDLPQRRTLSRRTEGHSQ